MCQETSWLVLVLKEKTGELIFSVLQGACKALDSYFDFSEFERIQPEGFALKTSLEIDLLDNKYNFENNVPVAKEIPVEYHLGKKPLVQVSIGVGNFQSLNICKFFDLALLVLSSYYR